LAYKWVPRSGQGYRALDWRPMLNVTPAVIGIRRAERYRYWRVLARRRRRVTGHGRDIRWFADREVAERAGHAVLPPKVVSLRCSSTS
jgi:hypothetical protein